MTIEAENGHAYELSENAVRRLQEARNARDADDVFEGFASHVPGSDRMGIWFAVDNVN